MKEQIEGMKKVICPCMYEPCECDTCCIPPFCLPENIAEALYNAGYRKQSENTVELPCKVGATIYLPWEFDGIRSIACLKVTHIIFDREHNYVKTDFDTDDEAYYDKYKCGRYEFEDFGKIVFLDKDEAEKALAKMKGGAEYEIEEVKGE